MSTTRSLEEERYPSKQTYVAAVKRAADDLVAERFLLKRAAERLIAEAEKDGIRKEP
jgi:hypothetical protein